MSSTSQNSVAAFHPVLRPWARTLKKFYPRKKVNLVESFSLQYRNDPDLPSRAHWAAPPLVQSEVSHL